MVPASDASSSDHCSIPKSIIIMVPNKHWTENEITGAASAYFEATQNAVKGVDQTHDSFKLDLLERWLELAPAIPPPDLWSNRLNNSLAGAAKLYTYIRDSIVKQLQKFNTSLRVVELSEPSGTNQEMNLNMAYAIFMNKTKTMSYDYKDFDIKRWKLYNSYNMLKVMPKLMLCDATSITGNSVDLMGGRGTKKGRKAAKKDLGDLKRKAFKDAERERRKKRVAERDDDTQECLSNITDELNEVRDCLDLFKQRMIEKDTEKKQRMIEKDTEKKQRLIERNQRHIEKHAMMVRKNQIKATIAHLNAETDSEKRKVLMTRLSIFSE
jgi:hypothetical protein